MNLHGPQTIIASDLFKRYGDRTVVEKFSCDVKRGEIVGLLGPNGAGKTTSFYMIMGLVKPDGGKVSLDGTDITKWPMHQRARAGVGYLAQDASVFRKLTVEENLMAILQLMPLGKAERRERCEKLLEEFELTARRRAVGAALSGGERRRTEIARTLAADPYFILLDEPFSGIDPRQVQEIQTIVKSLRTRGIGILITDHDVEDTLAVIDRGMILHNGRVEFEGTPAELLADPRARDIYFGDRIGRRDQN